MLHRMTTMLSAVVVGLVAAPVLSAAFPTSAQAAESCLARPNGSAASGSHWHYRINRVTHRKCWMLGNEEAPARNVTLPGWSEVTRLFEAKSPNQPAEKETAITETTAKETTVGCIAAPNGQAPRGSRWAYRWDTTTGQRCWHLRTPFATAQTIKIRTDKAEVAKIDRAASARSAESEPQITPKAPAAVLPPAVGDARAELPDADRRDTDPLDAKRLDEAVEPLRRIGAISQSGRLAAEGAKASWETFESRWFNLPDRVASRGDRLPSPANHSRTSQPVPSVADEVTNAIKAEPSLDVASMVFLVSLGGALLLFGLMGRSFLYVTSPWARPGGKPFDIAEVDDPSNPPPPTSDGQLAVDALLELAGAGQTDPDSSRGQRRTGTDRRRADPFAGPGNHLIG